MPRAQGRPVPSRRGRVRGRGGVRAAPLPAPRPRPAQPERKRRPPGRRPPARLTPSRRCPSVLGLWRPRFGPSAAAAWGAETRVQMRSQTSAGAGGEREARRGLRVCSAPRFCNTKPCKAPSSAKVTDGVKWRLKNIYLQAPAAHKKLVFKFAASLWTGRAQPYLCS